MASDPSRISGTVGADRSGDSRAGMPAEEEAVSIRHGAMFYLIVIGLLMLWNALQLALATSVIVTELAGNGAALHSGTVIAWSHSGGVMQLTYARDDIFSGGFQ